MKHILFLSLLLLMVGCAGERDFPEVKKLSEYKQTNFVATPANKLHEGKNSVYSVSMLLAWQQIKNSAESDLNIDAKYANLKMLNDSESFKNTLSEGEYEAIGGIDRKNGTVSASAEFSKSLPLAVKLNSYDDKLKFKGEKVKAFGFMKSDYDLFGSISILYYKDDENFVLKFFPRDEAHEIILYRCPVQPNTMQDGFNAVEKMIKIGKSERKIYDNSWKYHVIDDEDELLVPKFKFNIENSYKSLLGNVFKIKDKEFTVEKAWQRTAFILDETGAEIESEAELVTTTEESEDTNLKPHPKKLHFNKPFLIMLKRKDSPNPYFAMWVDNTELMQKN